MITRENIVLVALLASLSPVGTTSAQQPSFRDAINLFADSAAAYVAETFDPAVASLRLTADPSNLREVAIASTADVVRAQATGDLMPKGAATVDLRRLYACAATLDQYAGCGEDNTFFLRL